MMHRLFTVLAAALLGGCAPALASVPARWAVETSRARAVSFECYRGETLDLEAAFTSYGAPVDFAAGSVSLYWQTNGMGEAWWSAPASAASNVVTAAFSPSNDVGAASYVCFLGSPETSYRAAFRVRMLDAPGATPNALALPRKSIDFATVSVANAPWITADDAESKYLPLAGGVIQAGELDGKISMMNGATTWTDGFPGQCETKILPGKISLTANPIISLGFTTIGPFSFDGYRFNKGRNMLYLPFDFVLDYFTNSSMDCVVKPDMMLATAGMLDDSTNALVSALAAHSGRTDNPHEVTAEQVGAATTDDVNGVWAYLRGDNFRVVVTNYNSAFRPPRTRFEYRMSADDAWQTVWAEANGLSAAVAEATANATNAAEAVVSRPENRAWGNWDSHTGEAAPEGLVQVSGEAGLMIGGGMGWTSVGASGGSYWVLTSTDPTLCATGTNGVFTISDPDGNRVMTIRKGDKRYVPAPVGAVKMGADGNSFTVTYSVGGDCPVGYCAADLNGTWYAAGESGAPFALSWTGQSGAWVLTASAPGGGTFPKTGFFRAEYEVGGDTVVEYGAAVGLTKVSIGGKEYTVTVETVNGKNLMVLTE